MPKIHFRFLPILRTLLTESNHPKQPRALTYTEMMNGGQQRMDHRSHQQELELQRRKDVMERSIEHLEQVFKTDADQTDRGSAV